MTMIITIKLHPNSSQEKIEKIDENNFEVWLSEKPIDGKANEELCKMLKKYFKAKEVKINSGKTSRMKRVEIVNN